MYLFLTIWGNNSRYSDVFGMRKIYVEGWRYSSANKNNYHVFNHLFIQNMFVRRNGMPESEMER